MDLARLHAGRFILATNVLEPKTLTDEQILSEYKAQQSTERGFRFLKDPLCFASSVFLKTPRRIAALAMVMALSLLVYTLAQRTLRQSLAQQGQILISLVNLLLLLACGGFFNIFNLFTLFIWMRSTTFLT